VSNDSNGSLTHGSIAVNVKQRRNAIQSDAAHSASAHSPSHGQRWGAWRLNLRTLELEYVSDAQSNSIMYAIDLERCQTPAQLLDWIFQLHAKTWLSAKDAADLLAALDAVLYPQRNLCPGGLPRTLDVSALLSPQAAAAHAGGA
jgi:hypothetical protein